MRFNQRRAEANERMAERRRREDRAPRLIARVPRLESLRLEIEELRDGVCILESKHVRRIPVEHAPALFEFPCLDGFCEDGVHDLTQAIVAGLESGANSFEGQDACNGHTGANACHRVLHYVAIATYRP